MRKVSLMRSSNCSSGLQSIRGSMQALPYWQGGRADGDTDSRRPPVCPPPPRLPHHFLTLIWAA